MNYAACANNKYSLKLPCFSGIFIKVLNKKETLAFSYMQSFFALRCNYITPSVKDKNNKGAQQLSKANGKALQSTTASKAEIEENARELTRV